MTMKGEDARPSSETGGDYGQLSSETPLVKTPSTIRKDAQSDKTVESLELSDSSSESLKNAAEPADTTPRDRLSY